MDGIDKNHHEITHFKSRQTWVLLASLVTDPNTCRRDALAVRLWPDSSSARDNLRPTLTFLRKALGMDILIEDRDTLRLHPGAITTDLAAIAGLRDRAAATASAVERAALLREAALLLTGGFLDGCDTPRDGDGWLDQMRHTADELTADIWRRLAEALEEIGDQRGAFDAARRAYTLTPERTEVRDAVLRLAEGASRQDTIGLRVRMAEWEDLLPHLMTLEREQRPPTIREEQALAVALNDRLTALPAGAVTAFRSLAVFPQSFTATQAAAVAKAATETLTLLTGAALLSGEGERYLLPAAVRAIAWRSVPSAQRKRLRDRHAQYFGRAEGEDFSHRADPRIEPWLLAERQNLYQAMEWLCQHPLDTRSLALVMTLLTLSDTVPALRSEMQRHCAARLEEYARNPAMPGGSCHPATMLVYISLGNGDFHSAVAWARLAVDTGDHHAMAFASSLLRQSLPDALEALLAATHHANRDTDFDHTIALARNLVPQVTPEGGHQDLFHNRILHLLAENRYARGDYRGAWEANQEASRLMEKIQAENPARLCVEIAGHHCQRGCILLAAGDYTRALKEFDAALTLFRKQGTAALHGVADCLLNIGEILGKQGMTGTAREHIERAIALYGECAAEAARAAALGTLGDLHASLGDLTEARRLYEEGLAYWQEREHPRWTAKFRRRLESLASATGMGSAGDGAERVRQSEQPGEQDSRLYVEGKEGVIR